MHLVHSQYVQISMHAYTLTDTVIVHLMTHDMRMELDIDSLLEERNFSVGGNV